MEVRTCAAFPKAFFTGIGLAALRLLASDRRIWTRRNSHTSEQDSAHKPQLTLSRTRRTEWHSVVCFRHRSVCSDHAVVSPKSDTGAWPLDLIFS
jgi:hypothetical protein